jgi:hypothetical protein
MASWRLGMQENLWPIWCLDARTLCRRFGRMPCELFRLDESPVFLAAPVAGPSPAFMLRCVLGGQLFLKIQQALGGQLGEEDRMIEVRCLRPAPIPGGTGASLWASSPLTGSGGHQALDKLVERSSTSEATSLFSVVNDLSKVRELFAQGRGGHVHHMNCSGGRPSGVCPQNFRQGPALLPVPSDGRPPRQPV